MKTHPSLASVWQRRCIAWLGAASLLTAAPSILAATPPPGFTPLYNGKDLSGWWGLETEDPAKWMALPADAFAKKKAASLEDIKKHWSAQGEELVNDGHGLYLTTEKNYGDFELVLEYKTVAGADSGVYLRAIPQVQIWDSTEAGKKWGGDLGAELGSGGLWNNSKGKPGKNPLIHADKPFGEWNKFRVVMIGERVSVELNDKVVVDHARLENYFDRKSPVPKAGPIQLQTHGGEIRWRNLFVREISAEEANAILRAKDRAAGYYPIFSAATGLKGWEGPVAEYDIVGGALRCKPGKGGTIFYKAEEYADFTALLEFKLPPGGNNGLAIRYPGTGDAAYSGRCELQVLDDNYEKATGHKIDARQAHGSAYGMAAAHRGFQRPPGEWNYQRVTVHGSRIEVELNGTRILDTNLADVSEYMANSPHPGKDRKSGYFGLAGHADPVEFRQIEVRPIR
ncbi:MAG: DUF1080 domain-containing protein [Verrucomicrobiales bacterium]|nr:DUF1080 domain-containing protein [Verrucomicrobiales bacterium]